MANHYVRNNLLWHAGWDDKLKVLLACTFLALFLAVLRAEKSFVEFMRG